MDPKFKKPVEKKDTKSKKGYQFKLKINLWTVALTILVIFFVIPALHVIVQDHLRPYFQRNG